MMKTISEPREDYKPFVPRIKQFEIPKEFIGAVIGKGGETIQKIQAETGASVSIDEVDGKGIVDIATNDAEAMAKAYDWIMGICAVPEEGQVYHGKVVSILEFGAFVEILPGKEGLLHVSEIAWTKTENVEDVLKVGDEIDVKLLEIDQKTGKMRLSLRALQEKPEGYVEPERRPRPERGDRRDDRRGGRDDRRDDRRRDDRRGGRDDRRDDRRRDDRREDRGPRRPFGQRNNAPETGAPETNEPDIF